MIENNSKVQSSLEQYIQSPEIRLTIRKLISFWNNFFYSNLEIKKQNLLTPRLKRTSNLDIPLFNTNKDGEVKLIEIGKTNKKLVLARSSQMEKFYQQQIGTLKDETTDFDGLVYLIYSYDDNDNFKILYVGITRKYGKEIKCTCNFRANANTFSPKVIEKIELTNQIKHKAILTCPQCKKEFEKTISVNRNLTNPFFLGRLGYESARHLGQIRDAYFYRLGQLQEDDITSCRKGSLQTKLKWVKDFFGKNPDNPPHLLKPIYFSAVLWKEQEVPQLNNKVITLKSLEKILQDIGRLINPQILNEEFREISKSKSLIKTYQKILRLIEKLYGNLDTLSIDSLVREKSFTIQNIAGISRKAKQLDKTYKKWFKLETKNEKTLENLII